jgi:hypothetical protein
MFWLRRDVCLLVAFWLITLLGDVVTAQHGQVAPEAVPPEERRELVEGLAPISLLPIERRLREVGAREWLAEHLAEVGGERLHVVRGTVVGLTAMERSFPAELHAEAGIGTTVDIAVAESYCGPSDDVLTATYIGGQLPDGRREFTSQMPRDLRIGKAYVFLMNRIDGEWFLETGSLDVLRVTDDGDLRVPFREQLTFEDIRRACP